NREAALSSCFCITSHKYASSTLLDFWLIGVIKAPNLLRNPARPTRKRSLAPTMRLYERAGNALKLNKAAPAVPAATFLINVLLDFSIVKISLSVYQICKQVYNSVYKRFFQRTLIPPPSWICNAIEPVAAPILSSVKSTMGCP